MSLRVRLVLIVLAVAVPSGIAHVISHAIDRDIQAQVADLRRESWQPLDAATVVGSSLSLEGEWDARGFFAVRSIENLARQRRPKLRGAIQAVADDGSFSMYGVSIRVGPNTELPRFRGGADGAWRPEVGARVEVSCAVDDAGTWVSRKIRCEDLKSSDKLKGIITRATPHSSGELVLEITGLRMHAPHDAHIVVARGPVHRMEIAGQMTRALQECLAAAQEMLKIRYVGRAAQTRGASDHVLPLTDLQDVEDRLLDANAEFAHLLADSRASAEDVIARAEAAGESGKATTGRARLAQSIDPLAREQASVAGNVQHMVDLAAVDLDKAQTFVQDTLEPQIRRDILPRVQALQIGVEEELSEELTAIGTRSASAARLSLMTSVSGLVMAVAVGLFVARSVARPVVELETAARRIGAGDLGARVTVRSHDELGALAASFNHMAEHLAASTVSVAHLNGVIDSVAGALFLLGPDGAITSVNPAALTLLGYAPGDLIGAAFVTVCPGDPGRGALRAAEEGEPLPRRIVNAVHDSAGSGPRWAAGEARVAVTSGEQVFRRRDGSAIPVSFSGAVLRGEGGVVRGFVCLAEDLSERKRMEEALRRSLGEKELLLRELHHRVKNNLQVISSLLDLQSREVTDQKALSKFQDSQDRIRSLVLIHEQLYRARDLAAVDMRVYLELLAANLAQAHVDPPGRVRVETDVEELRLDLDRALACGLIVNELVTNALKHAFSADTRGSIAISFRSYGERIALGVCDDGRGMPSDNGERLENLGMQLVNALCGQLGGHLAVEERMGAGQRGTAWRIEFPSRVAQEIV